MTPALRIDRVAKTFETDRGVVRALEPVSIDIRQGEFISVIGPSGCGKSTLMNIVGGLIEDYEGAVYVDGEQVRGSPSASSPAEWDWRLFRLVPPPPWWCAGMTHRRRRNRAFRHPPERPRYGRAYDLGFAPCKASRRP